MSIYKHRYQWLVQVFVRERRWYSGELSWQSSLGMRF